MKIRPIPSKSALATWQGIGLMILAASAMLAGLIWIARANNQGEAVPSPPTTGAADTSNAIW